MTVAVSLSTFSDAAAGHFSDKFVDGDEAGMDVDCPADLVQLLYSSFFVTGAATWCQFHQYFMSSFFV
jgi:hypothetical protein